MRKKGPLKKAVVLLLSAIVIIAVTWVLPADIAESIGAAGDACAQSPAQAINLVTPTTAGDVSNPGNGTWDYVYFGTYQGKPLKFRVLDKSTSIYGTSNTMFLDCDTILETMAYDNLCNTWVVSNVRDWLNGDDFYNNSSVFTPAERNIIVESFQPEMPEGFSLPTTFRYGFSKLTGERVFLLDASDVNNQYGYFSDETRAKKGDNPIWWLRSPHVYDLVTLSNVGPTGHINCLIHIEEYGVSPALNIDLSSILLISDAGSSKPVSLSEPDNASLNDKGTHDWQLTLLDPKQSVTVGRVTRDEDIITLQYRYNYDSSNGTDTEASKISVLITDGEYSESGSAIKYYAQVADIAPSGNVSIDLGTLPDYDDSMDKIYLFSETNNGAYKSDYASVPQPVVPQDPYLTLIIMAAIILMVIVTCCIKVIKYNKSNS